MHVDGCAFPASVFIDVISVSLFLLPPSFPLVLFAQILPIL